MTHVSICITKK